MKCLKFSALVVLLTGLFAAHAQTTAGNRRGVVLNVVAMDSAGNPVPDLSASDFAVFDNGSPQQIASLRVNQSDKPHPLVVLIDLVNSSEDSRGAVWNAVKTSLAGMRSTGPVYLYLLAEDGSLYAVHALPPAAVAQETADDSWMENIGPLMDAAMKKVSQLRPEDFRASSQVSLQVRFKATYSALDQMRALMTVLSGPKELLWVTYGIPSAIRMADRDWFDGVPFLRQLGARFVQSETTVYTADPGMNLATGILNRDSLDILTGATGGRAFATVDLTRAIRQIQAAARLNYTIDYQPSAKNWDGKYHKLRVTIDRKGVHLQTELGYFAVLGS